MLINNAGVSGGIGAIETLDDPGWRWTIDVNLMGVVYGANVFVPRMKQQGEPAWLINVASMAGMAGVPLAGAYTATKAAVVALTEAWALELAKSNDSRIRACTGLRQNAYPPVLPQPSAPLCTHDRADTGRHRDREGHLGRRGGRHRSGSAQRPRPRGPRSGRAVHLHPPELPPITDQRAAIVAGGFDSAGASPLLQEVARQPINFGFSDG
jgi:NAD(P)-dependent dehydrogenase (short-subunit alcohol dehydrogenase family)